MHESRKHRSYSMDMQISLEEAKLKNKRMRKKSVSFLILFFKHISY